MITGRTSIDVASPPDRLPLQLRARFAHSAGRAGHCGKLLPDATGCRSRCAQAERIAGILRRELRSPTPALRSRLRERKRRAERAAHSAALTPVRPLRADFFRAPRREASTRSVALVARRGYPAPMREPWRLRGRFLAVAAMTTCRSSGHRTRGSRCSEVISHWFRIPMHLYFDTAYFGSCSHSASRLRSCAAGQSTSRHRDRYSVAARPSALERLSHPRRAGARHHLDPGRAGGHAGRRACRAR